MLIQGIGTLPVSAQNLPYTSELFLNTEGDWAQLQADITRRRIQLREEFTVQMQRVRHSQARGMARLKGRYDRDARRRARFQAKAELARLRESYRYQRGVLQAKIRWARREHSLRQDYSAGAYMLLGK